MKPAPHTAAGGRRHRPDGKRFRSWLAGGVLALVALAAPAADAPPAASGFAEVPATAATLKALRAGGFVLYLRHGRTDNSRADRMPTVDLDDCGTQRPLIEAGRQASADVGEALRRARIPIGEIHSSPLCRARESAGAAFPRQPVTVDAALMYTANMTDRQKAPILANTRRLLSAPVAPGSNRVVVAHAPNLMDLIGYFPKESTLVVFRPRQPADGDAGGFTYIASIPPTRWRQLLP